MRSFATLSFIMTLLVSCEKEKFPEQKQLQGTWKEITENTFKHKLRFENETMYFFKSNSIDTLTFRLDDNKERMYLQLKNHNSEIESKHKIKLNKKRNELTVWNLFITIGNETETIFKKE